MSRALEAGASPDDPLFVLGHGTKRNAASSNAVREQVERVRAMNRFAEVTAVFTDQEPNLASIPELARGRNATVVPFFASEGWHVGQVAATNETPGIRYTEPAGTHPVIAALITDLAREAASA